MSERAPLTKEQIEYKEMTYNLWKVVGIDQMYSEKEIEKRRLLKENAQLREENEALRSNIMDLLKKYPEIESSEMLELNVLDEDS